MGISFEALEKAQEGLAGHGFGTVAHQDITFERIRNGTITDEERLRLLRSFIMEADVGETGPTYHLRSDEKAITHWALNCSPIKTSWGTYLPNKPEWGKPRISLLPLHVASQEFHNRSFGNTVIPGGPGGNNSVDQEGRRVTAIPKNFNFLVNYRSLYLWFDFKLDPKDWGWWVTCRVYQAKEPPTQDHREDVKAQVAFDRCNPLPRQEAPKPETTSRGIAAVPGKVQPDYVIRKLVQFGREFDLAKDIRFSFSASGARDPFEGRTSLVWDPLRRTKSFDWPMGLEIEQMVLVVSDYTTN